MWTENGETGIKLPLEDVTYSLTVHDILSAFQFADDGLDDTPNYKAQAGEATLHRDDERALDELRNALRLVMACAGDIDKATDADLESALECGDAETEKQANAWLVARAALRPSAGLDTGGTK